MSQAFVPGLEITTSTTLRRRRELPLKGKTLVKLGSQVRSSDLVASAELPGDLRILRLPEKLGIEPVELLALLKTQGIAEGQSVKENQLLCEHKGLFGLFRTTFNAPIEGRVEFISSSSAHIGLREKSRELQIDAFISGKVVEVEEGHSVTIESEAAFVQGIFGVGGERRGEISLLKVPANQKLDGGHIPEDVAGKILVGGMLPSIEAIKKASLLGAKGLIVGSLDDKALTSYLGYDLGVALTGDENISMTLIITEGFGELPISQRVLDVLSKFNGREASINGATQVRAGAIRPEIIICRGQEQRIERESKSNTDKSLSVGTSVRIVRVPYFGKRGKVIELPHAPQLIESGAECRVVRVQLESAEVVTVPRANVEIT